MHPATDSGSVDAACVRRVLKGERFAYDEIVVRYESRLFALILMMIRDRSATEEVVQDTFSRAYTNLKRYDLNRPFYPWLATIAVRLGTNWSNRSGARQKRETPIDELADTPTATSTPSGEYERHRTYDKLWRKVAKLSQGERTAVLMFYKQEMTVQEISSALGVTTGTVKTSLYRGRKHLRAQFESSGEI